MTVFRVQLEHGDHDLAFLDDGSRTVGMRCRQCRAEVEVFVMDMQWVEGLRRAALTRFRNTFPDSCALTAAQLLHEA